MGYFLNGTQIRRPSGIKEANSTQSATNRVLSGNVTKDFFGSNKRIWIFDYQNLNATDYATINAIYQAYLSAGSPVSFSSTETNYPITANVHVEFLERDFSIPGSSYISNNTLTLTEA